MKALSELIKTTTERFGRNTAVICAKERLSYLELSRKIDELAAYLFNKGVNYQDRAAVFLPNSPLFIISFFALARIGAVAMTLNTNYKEAELKNYLKVCRVKFVISNKQGRQMFKKVLRNLSCKLIIADDKD